MPDGNRKGRIGKADGKNAPARSENRQFGQGGRCGFGGFLSRTFLFSRNTAYNLSGDPGLRLKDQLVLWYNKTKSAAGRGFWFWLLY